MLKLTDVTGAVTHVAHQAVRPTQLVHSVESLVTQLGQVATRALALLDVAESVPPRIDAIADRVEGIAARADQAASQVEAIVVRAEKAAGQVEDLTGRASSIATKAAKATDQASGTVDAVQPLLSAVTTIDPAMVGKLGPLLEDVIALLPALASLPPVIETLAAQVDHLDQTVADVGALLQGIPGAARLMKRAGNGPERLPGR